MSRRPVGEVHGTDHPRVTLSGGKGGRNHLEAELRKLGIRPLVGSGGSGHVVVPARRENPLRVAGS